MINQPSLQVRGSDKVTDSSGAAAVLIADKEPVYGASSRAQGGL